MTIFCDVALPVPLDMAFTYKIAEQQPVVGGRVLVPFRNQRVSGVVTALHDRAPSMHAKTVIQVLDSEPVLDEGLMKLGQWIAQYYLAPIGDVFRGMLPLAAEIKKAKLYRITEVGYEALHASATAGSSRRSKQDIDTQMIEYAVLDYLSMSQSEAALEGTIRSATGANRQVLDLLLRKKWIAREDVSSVRDAQRTVQVAVLKEASGKLNENQQKIKTFLQEQSGRAFVEQVRELAVPRTTLQTLIKRALLNRGRAGGFQRQQHEEAGPVAPGLYLQRGTESRSDDNSKIGDRREIFSLAAAWRDGFRQDGGLSGGNAGSAGAGARCDFAGAGDRTYAGCGGEPASGLWG